LWACPQDGKDLKVLGFTRIFRVYATENEALLAFKAA